MAKRTADGERFEDSRDYVQSLARGLSVFGGDLIAGFREFGIRYPVREYAERKGGCSVKLYDDDAGQNA